ncbi:phosphotransferase enzyme family protein [Sphingobacterium hungaricum]
MIDTHFNKINPPANQFKLNGHVVSIVPFGSGHINDTFKVQTDSDEKNAYLLQKINHQIFQDVDGLMNNIKEVCKHIKSKLSHLNAEEVEKHSMTLIETKNGESFCKDEEGNYWRVFKLIENTKSYDIVETPAQAFSGGKAFGQFQKQLSDLPAEKLTEILPNFHNIDFRLGNLKEAIAKNEANRVGQVEDLLSYISNRESKMRTILKMGNRGELPVRITHNDTKFNNVLLDEDDKVQCVIDLDTVMPGYIAYDFGDAIRTIINSAAEDEADLDKIKLNIPLFQAYAEGYLSEAKDFLTENELETLLHGVYLLPYMQAVRFLTDYLNGDTYYKVHYSDHNLVRTKSQLKLVDELEKHHEELKLILHDSISV